MAATSRPELSDRGSLPCVPHGPGGTSLEHPRRSVGAAPDWPRLGSGSPIIHLEQSTMIVVMLFTQLATTAPAVDSVYSSPAVRALVTAAAAENWRLTQLVPAFRARRESQLAIVTQDSIDREITLFAQQHASSVEWKNGSFDVRVTAA